MKEDLRLCHEKEGTPGSPGRGVYETAVPTPTCPTSRLTLRGGRKLHDLHRLLEGGVGVPRLRRTLLSVPCTDRPGSVPAPTPDPLFSIPPVARAETSGSSQSGLSCTPSSLSRTGTPELELRQVLGRRIVSSPHSPSPEVGQAHWGQGTVTDDSCVKTLSQDTFGIPSDGAPKILHER